MKKYAVTASAAGILLLATGIITLHIPLEGIGALRALIWTAVLLGGALILTGAGAAVFRTPIEKHCSAWSIRKTVEMSAMSGMFCSFALIKIAEIFGNTLGFHPDSYKISTLPVVFCLLGCIAHGCLYLEELRITQKYKRLFFDIPAFILFMPAFMFGWAYLSDIIARIFRQIHG